MSAGTKTPADKFCKLNILPINLWGRQETGPTISSPLLTIALLLVLGQPADRRSQSVAPALAN